MLPRTLILSGAVALSACGGGGVAPAPTQTSTPIVLPATVLAAPVTFIEIGVSGDGNALFNPLAPHVASNIHGTFVAYVSSPGQQKIVQSVGSAWQVVGEISTPTTVCIAAEPDGALWAAWGDAGVDPDKVHIRRWASPTAPPVQTEVASDQGQNNKYSCAWDEGRKAFWFIGSGFELLRFNTNAQLVNRQDLMDYMAPYMTMYPGLKVALNGDLELAWMTIDLSSGGRYRSMEYMRSTDTANWSATGAAPFAATPTLEIVGDETGPAFHVASQLLGATSFLSDFISDAGWNTHFAWWYVPNAEGRCFLAISNCSLGYRRSSAPPVTTFSADSESPRGATGVVFGLRGSQLYLVTAYADRIVWFISDDRGVTWSKGGSQLIPDIGTKCIRDFDGIPTPSGFTGAMAIWNGDCPSWANSNSPAGETRVLGWTLKL